MTPKISAEIPPVRAMQQRVAGRVAALVREYPRVRRGQELTHLARLLIIRDDAMDALAAGHLEVQRMRLLSETNRQIESVGARLGIFSPMPLAGQEATPTGPAGSGRHAYEEFMR